MHKTIAITGKGGVGKTATSALVVRALLDAGEESLLAIDADPNLNFDAALGLKATEFVGCIREEALDRQDDLPAGMTKTEFLTYRAQEALLETDRFDFLAMGRPEGPGCYCYANNVLRHAIDSLAKGYDYLVVDCEAGLEHFSRRTTGDIDVLFVLTDSSLRSADTVFRVMDLVEDLKTHVGKTLVVVTRSDDIPAPILQRAAEHNIEIAGAIPNDPEVRALDDSGQALLNVSDMSTALQAVKGLLGKAGVLKAALV
ncbi:MAG: carbon monoxide dehydrogenase [Armatimonadetes bacterium]|nr:carbon monoxide dehydrogenase [Armatimonadota bacterium]